MIDYKNLFIAWYYNEFAADPLYCAMAQLSEDSPWHRERSIGIHTNMVVTEYIARALHVWSKADVIGAFAAAFHDVGKPRAVEYKSSEARGNYKSFGGHELLSARLWEDWAVRNSERLRAWEFTPIDVYKVGWMIDNHLPWGLKDSIKLNKLALTAHCIGRQNFITLLQADTWGRLSDDWVEKRQKVENWITSTLVVHNECVPIIDSCSIATATCKPNQPVLWISIAASGSGKSTWLATLREQRSAIHYSWDDLRMKWYDPDPDVAFKMSVEDQTFAQRCSDEFRQVIQAASKANNDVYVDNTNLSTKRRRQFIDAARQRGYYIQAVLFPVELDTIIQRQLTRNNGGVPEFAVKRQYESLQLPQLGEFDAITVVSANM